MTQRRCLGLCLCQKLDTPVGPPRIAGIPLPPGPGREGTMREMAEIQGIFDMPLKSPCRFAEVMSKRDPPPHPRTASGLTPAGKPEQNSQGTHQP